MVHFVQPDIAVEKIIAKHRGLYFLGVFNIETFGNTVTLHKIYPLCLICINNTSNNLSSSFDLLTLQI